MRLFIVRHGESVCNAEGRFQGQHDTELSRRGFEQGLKVAEFLKHQRFDAVATSPLKRSSVTARKIAEMSGCDVIEELSGLTEICRGLGDLPHERGHRALAEAFRPVAFRASYRGDAGAGGGVASRRRKACGPGSGASGIEIFRRRLRRFPRRPDKDDNFPLSEYAAFMLLERPHRELQPLHYGAARRTAAKAKSAWRRALSWHGLRSAGAEKPVKFSRASALAGGARPLAQRVFAQLQ